MQLTQGTVDLVEKLPSVLLVGVHLCPCNCICNCSSVHSLRSCFQVLQLVLVVGSFCFFLTHSSSSVIGGSDSERERVVTEECVVKK